MGKYCGKCGSELEKDTGLCPNCDKKKKKTKKRYLKRLIKGIILCGILSGIVYGAAYIDTIDISFLNDLKNINILSEHTEEVERNIPESDTSGFTYYQSSEKNIVSDPEKGIMFVNNELLVVLQSGDRNRDKLEKFMSGLNGSIVGNIEDLCEYQILFEQNYSLEELKNIAKEIEDQEWVISVTPNYCFQFDTTYIPNDRKWENKWGDIPEGTNWGVEAIDMPEAWEYLDHMSPVNIGIIDTMFDLNHEDLIFAEKPLGNTLAVGKNKWDDHGTHVSGTIAATMNNKKGIAGICPTGNIYGVSYEGVGTAGLSSLMLMKVAWYYLIVEKRCSVINMSIAMDHMTFEASRGGKAATEELQTISFEIEKDLERYIEEGYQFVICKSAGNQNKVNGGDKYKYFKKDEDDIEYPYEYYNYGEYLSYLNGKTVANEKYLKRYKEDKKKIQKRLESGNVDAEYDFLGMIDNPKVKKRIIMVGSVENLTHKEGFLWINRKTVHDGYSIAEYSQCGKRVDILAPGTGIYSTVRNGYDSKSGTSMAAPHASGVAALLFSLVPGLKADEVKKILCDTAQGSYDEEQYGLLNAANAVKRVLKEMPDSTKNISNTEGLDIVIALDVSSSMNGTPLTETKKAAVSFIDSISEEKANVGVVKYEGEASKASVFSQNAKLLKKAISNIDCLGGGTNIEDGLAEAYSMLKEQNGKKKIIILMSDGEPTRGKEGDELIEFADEMKAAGIIIYTLGFFEELGSEKASAQTLMERIASDGCHYEVGSIEEMSFFFEDIADIINGQHYMYVRIACPVDVTVSYKNEELSSEQEKLNTRTDFGVLSFEENTESGGKSDDRIKILRLKEGVGYDIQIKGNGLGIMNYTIAFMDENGEYNDFRRFEDIKINRHTIIDTTADLSEETLLKVDQDGDGKYDLIYCAEENGYGKEIEDNKILIFIMIGSSSLMLLLLIAVLIKLRKNKRKKEI